MFAIAGDCKSIETSPASKDHDHRTVHKYEANFSLKSFPVSIPKSHHRGIILYLKSVNVLQDRKSKTIRHIPLLVKIADNVTQSGRCAPFHVLQSSKV